MPPLTPGTISTHRRAAIRALFPPNYTLGRSWQSSLGVQRDLGHDLVLTADWARRQGSHFNLTNDLDINYTNWFVNGVTHPIIPVCAPALRSRAGMRAGTDQ